MALSRYIAAKGTVGSTARWVAQCFLSYFVEHRVGEFATNEALRREIDKIVVYALNIRFQGDLNHPDCVRIRDFYARNERDFGLLGFTCSILAVEAGFYKNSRENIRMFADVIEEELERAGVGPVIALGNTSSSYTQKPSPIKNGSQSRRKNKQSALSRRVIFLIAAGVVTIILLNK